MPNWISNELDITHSDASKLDELKELFKGERPFNKLIPEPDWPNIPASKDLTQRFDTTKVIAKKGELPEKEVMKLANGDEHIFWNWPSSGNQDDRWYGWRVKHWGCKWDLNHEEVEVDEFTKGELCISFTTPWAPPDEIYRKLVSMGYEISRWEWQDEDPDSYGDLALIDWEWTKHTKKQSEVES